MNQISQPQGCLVALLDFVGFRLNRSDSNEETAGKKLTYSLKDSLHTPAELSFHHCLVSAIGDDYFLATKVRWIDIFQPTNDEEYITKRNKIDRKHVDFLLCSPQTMKPQLIIELDDSSHRTNKKTIERDDFLKEICESTGIALLRVRAAKSYSISELRNIILVHINGQSHSIVENSTPQTTERTATPLCPKCQSHMKLRTASRGEKKGQKFWGCDNYPSCKGVMPAL
ncbi:Topoisomerase DNA binding C4 zinc finger [Polystyrenella longa]|uniref:Topoisomerase DNA binding C4 zinc finger n=1 Tax=Polystyrenella longa TaxID=2528007 RepID=A0A518CKM3_9PLAN|nr:DUF2726 domain-containing protein [Polystyrenella longa]QDU79734.1 Topoisomerase DNA binding C4 zinc finger [Polystyrenella longa]